MTQMLKSHAYLSVSASFETSRIKKMSCYLLFPFYCSSHCMSSVCFYQCKCPVCAGTFVLQVCGCSGTFRDKVCRQQHFFFLQMPPLHRDQYINASGEGGRVAWPHVSSLFYNHFHLKNPAFIPHLSAALVLFPVAIFMEVLYRQKKEMYGLLGLYVCFDIL